ncbi:MAG TPA: winged helix DNA-binding protein [Candidatus Competibacteraceae bacterium]|nr:winged helix DNA-binding protein [Candidatus Competibacteraceae bacterium]
MPKQSPIVSSAHLVSETAPGLSELEFALIIAGNAFNRWITRCAAAAGARDLGPLDVLVLHHVNHREREKRLADICFVLNIEDTHLVNYSLKKLRTLGLVETARLGKEVVYTTSEAGKRLCETYREVRESCLIGALSALGAHDDRDFHAIAETLRALSGIYDQAARASSSL